MAGRQRYEGVIEAWSDQSLLYIPSLPGFIASAPDRDALIELSLDALDLHLDWLKGHGYPSALEDEAGLVVLEDLDAIGQIGPLFTVDLPEPNDEQIELALGVGRVTLSDVVDLIDVINAVNGANPDVTRVVRHICVLDIWYSTRLGGDDPALRPIADPVDAMIAVAGMFEERIDELNETGNAGSNIVDGEEWTLAKLLRRRTAHLREHGMELAALLPDD